VPETPRPKKSSQISLVIIGLSLGVVLIALGRWGVGYTHTLGLDAEEAGDHQTARSLWGITAAMGYTPSKATLGALYLTGKGGLPDAKLAGKYLADAAEDGYADAQSVYGMALYTGSFLPLDRTRGLYWLRKAAEQGDLEAFNFLRVAGEK